MKYIGSKSKLAKEILPFMQKDIDNAFTYLEPFCGGCNMIDKVNHKDRYASDGNYYLIAMWKALQEGWEPPDSIDKETYFAVRQSFLSGNSPLAESQPHMIGFIGHNCSFSGDWFAGYAGTGETRNRCAEAKRHLLKQINNLKDVEFYYNDYNDWNLKGALIYCDPPYYNGFKYKGSNFDFNHEQFWEWCREQAKNNTVYVSDYYAPDDFELIWEKEIVINAHQKKQKQATEKLYKLGLSLATNK
jgi:DNA adenine methylase